MSSKKPVNDYRYSSIQGNAALPYSMPGTGKEGAAYILNHARSHSQNPKRARGKITLPTLKFMETF